MWLRHSLTGSLRTISLGGGNWPLRKQREGKHEYTVQYQNLRVDFDIELCTHACPLSRLEA